MPELTHDEFMAVVCGRQIRDNETIAVGVSSPVPTAGAKFAQLAHAGNTTFLVEGMMKPFFRGSYEVSGLAQIGKLDLFYFSAVQIDPGANFNMQYIGDRERPKKRFLGAFASPVYYNVIKRTVILCNHHNKNVFVPKLDYVTATAKDHARHRRGGWPDKVITPMAILSFNRDTELLELESCHPGVRPEDVQAETGFPLRLAGNYHETPMPSEKEAAIMHGPVKDWMHEKYPAW